MKGYAVSKRRSRRYGGIRLTGQSRWLGALLPAVVGGLLVSGCGSSGSDAESQRAEQAGEARAAVAYADETSAVATKIARLPRNLDKPKAAASRARELGAQARDLAQLPQQEPPASESLKGAYEDLSAANRQLARSARKVEKAAVAVRDGSREPDLGGAKRNLKEASRRIESGYGGIDEFVATELDGSVTVGTAPDLKLAKAKLPPLPDLIFNMNDAGEAQVGNWSPSPVNAELAGAVEIFGPPDISCSQQTEGSLGTNEWTGLGLKAIQANFGSGEACEGSVQIVEVGGDAAKQWVTEAGLRVGDPESKVRELYPGASDLTNPQSPGETGLVLASTAGAVPRDLVALTEGGSVVGLRIWVGGAGE